MLLNSRTERSENAGERSKTRRAGRRCRCDPVIAVPIRSGRFSGKLIAPVMVKKVAPMNDPVPGFAAAILVSIAFSLSPAWAIAEADNECSASGEYAFVCGLRNPEDLVLVPGTK